MRTIDVMRRDNSSTQATTTIAELSPVAQWVYENVLLPEYAKPIPAAEYARLRTGAAAAADLWGQAAMRKHPWMVRDYAFACARTTDYPYEMTATAAWAIAKIALEDNTHLITDAALSAAEAVLFRLLGKAVSRASALSGRKGVKAARAERNDLTRLHQRVKDGRGWRETEPEGLSELTPDAYVMLAAMVDANPILVYRSEDVAQLCRTAAAVAA